MILFLCLLYFFLCLALNHMWNIAGYEHFRDGDVLSWGRTLGGYRLYCHLCLCPGPASRQIQALSSWQHFSLDLLFAKSRLRRKSWYWDKYAITCDLTFPFDVSPAKIEEVRFDLLSEVIPVIFKNLSPVSSLSFLLTNLPVWAFSTFLRHNHTTSQFAHFNKNRPSESCLSSWISLVLSWKYYSYSNYSYNYLNHIVLRRCNQQK